MAADVLRIATRSSALALKQTKQVVASLKRVRCTLAFKYEQVVTTGDKNQYQSLCEIGGKSLFIKELEQCLLNRSADLAVHSMKDVPSELPQGLSIEAVLKRADSADAFVSVHWGTIGDMPHGAVIGTSSRRRKLQLLHYFPNLKVACIRGNIVTRLRKLDEGRYDALLLASAGLARLGQGARIRHTLPQHNFVPSIGQGVIGVECRKSDHRVCSILRTISDLETYTCLRAERYVGAALGANCFTPLGVLAKIYQTTASMHCWLGIPESTQAIQTYRIASREKLAAWLPARVVGDMVGRGALEFVRQFVAIDGCSDNSHP